MFRGKIALLLVAVPIAAQVLVVDRGPTPASVPQKVERTDGFLADAFRIGASGETWMIDTIRLWALPSAGSSCPRELGDQIEKLTLLGALDNPPVPGQPPCDCHALVVVADAPLQPGTSRSSNPSVKLSAEKGMWRIDFSQVRWSVPGDMDVLFSLRASARREDACHAATEWKLASSLSSDGHRLHLLDKAGVPQGLTGADIDPRTIHIQVWAHRIAP